MVERFLGVPIEVHDRVGSTNDVALGRGEEGAPEGLIVRTREQVAGRGRMGRDWWGSRDASIAFSVLLRPTIPFGRFPLFAIAMAASVAETGRRLTRAPLTVKWPNDVLHEGRKLCGILAESRGGGRASPALVVGVGVNVNQAAAEFPGEIRARATSLRLAAGERQDVEAVFAGILDRFAAYLAAARSGGSDALFEALASWLPETGAAVRVRSGKREIEGRIEGIELNGALRVREADGAVTTVSAGEIP